MVVVGLNPAMVVDTERTYVPMTDYRFGLTMAALPNGSAAGPCCFDRFPATGTYLQEMSVRFRYDRPFFDNL